MSETTITKPCSKCKLLKPFSEFYIDRSKKDGHQSNCKICKLACDKRYIKTEKGKKVQNRYRQSEKGIANQKLYRKSEQYKIAQTNARRRWETRNPEKHKAQIAVNNAIKSGSLPRPNTLQCHYCPAKAKQYHHHKGYAKEHWLDVVPVCTKCHNNITP